MKIRCLLRESVTSQAIDGFRYDFVPNKHGHYVCNVQNPHHRALLLGMGKQCYQEYEEPPVETTSDLVEKPANPEGGGKTEAELETGGVIFNDQDFGATAINPAGPKPEIDFISLEEQVKQAMTYYEGLGTKQELEAAVKESFPGVDFDLRKTRETLNAEVRELVTEKLSKGLSE